MTTYLFHSSPKRYAYFCGAADLWPILTGTFYIGPQLRGWFYCPVPIPIATRGEIALIIDGQEYRSPVVIIRWYEWELGQLRHEFTSVESEVPPLWLPPSEPVTLDVLKKMYSGGWDGARVVIDAEGAWRVKGSKN